MLKARESKKDWSLCCHAREIAAHYALVMNAEVRRCWVKALILAAGKGSRLDMLPDGENKCMIRVNGYPLLYYHLLRAVALQVEQIIIVIGHAGNLIMQHFGHCFQQIPISYVWQKELRGPVSAIDAAVNLLDDDFVLMLADEYFVQSNHVQMYNMFRQAELFGLCGIIDGQVPESVQKTYAVMADNEGRVFQLIEKPDQPLTSAKGTGLCFFQKEILRYIPNVSIDNDKGEKEFPALVQLAIDNGAVVHALSCCKRFYNLNNDEDCAFLRSVEQAEICMPDVKKAG